MDFLLSFHGLLRVSDKFCGPWKWQVSPSVRHVLSLHVASQKTNHTIHNAKYTFKSRILWGLGIKIISHSWVISIFFFYFRTPKILLLVVFTFVFNLPETADDV